MDTARYDRALSAYEPFTDPDRRQHIRTLADDLDGTRVLHVNSTASGGGVAEILHSLVPLLNDVGVDTDWFVMEADRAFFDITKEIHNGLQGRHVPLTEDAITAYRSTTARNAAAIESEYDVIVLHDPQPLGMVEHLAEQYPNTRFVWRCHLDLTDATNTHLEFITGYVRRVDRVIVSRSAYEERIDGPPTTIVHPSIDPLADKNRSLDRSEMSVELNRLEQTGLDFDAPIVTQISRFDPWKGQIDVIDAFQRVKRNFPETQLVLAGGAATDDPESIETYQRIASAAADYPNVFLLQDLLDATVNALQRRSDIVLQPSIREGFGLVVSEALWKRTPVVGTNAGGIPLQIVDGENGFLVEPNDVAALASRTTALLGDEVLRSRFGRRGRATVRDGFLLPRQLADFLELLVDLRQPV